MCVAVGDAGTHGSGAHRLRLVRGATMAVALGLSRRLRGACVSRGFRGFLRHPRLLIPIARELRWNRPERVWLRRPRPRPFRRRLVAGRSSRRGRRGNGPRRGVAATVSAAPLGGCSSTEWTGQVVSHPGATRLPRPTVRLIPRDGIIRAKPPSFSTAAPARSGEPRAARRTKRAARSHCADRPTSSNRRDFRRGCQRRLRKSKSGASAG